MTSQLSTPVQGADVPHVPLAQGLPVSFERGDKVLYMGTGYPVETVESVDGQWLCTDRSSGYRHGYALLPPDADGDLVALASILSGAIVLALRRRLPKVQFAVHTGLTLLRVQAPTLDGSASAPGYLSVHECAYAACYGATPREALARVVSMLYHQLAALDDGMSVRALSLVQAELSGKDFVERERFLRPCGEDGDPFIAWREVIEAAEEARS